MENFSQKINDLIRDINSAIRPIISTTKFEGELNYRACSVEVLNDDAATIWVKWGPYDCNFESLPAVAMATVADNIIRLKL